MDHWDSEPDGTERTPLTDLAVLWTARDPEELWRALVVSAGRSSGRVAGGIAAPGSHRSRRRASRYSGAIADRCTGAGPR